MEGWGISKEQHARKKKHPVFSFSLCVGPGNFQMFVCLRDHPETNGNYPVLIIIWSSLGFKISFIV